MGNSVRNIYGSPAISRRHALGLAFGLISQPVAALRSR